MAKKSKKKNEADDEVMNDISSCVSSVSQAVTQLASDNKQKKETENNPHYILASLLARKLEEMRPFQAERFKLKVDMMAIELLEENQAD